MCEKIWSTFRVQCFSLTLLIIHISFACYGFASDKKTNVLCNKRDQNLGNCKVSMDIILITFLSFNIPGCLLLSLSAACRSIYFLILWLFMAIIQIPVAFFGSLWLFCWYKLMDPTPALIFAGLVLLYGCVLLTAWVFAYDLLFTIRSSREQRKVTALVLVVYEI